VSRAFWEVEESETVRRLRLGATTFSVLALELALIRWTGSQIRIFAYFANLVVLAGFLGMGLGIALGRQRVWLVRASLPLLAVLSALLAFSPQLGLTYLNFADPSILLWGAEKGGSPWTFLGSAVAVVVLFWLVVAVFLTAAAPVGWLFDRLPPLTAYSADLLGSLLGVVALAALAALDTSPVVWMAVAALPLLAMAPRADSLASAAAVLILAGVSVRGAFFSPYNRLDLERWSPSGSVRAGTDWVLRANRDFHQYLYDLSDPVVLRDPARRRLQAVYELPFRIAKRHSTALIVGAGTGNDVAAALRRGSARVVSVEIDPLILDIGRRLHPERPYSDPRVVPVVNDARAYFEQNPETRFDIVCYGLLDSHTLFSSISSLRLENYVYSVEGIRAGWEHVAPDGVLSICFSVSKPWMAQRLVRLVEEATGLRPVVILHGMASGVTLLVGRGVDPAHLPTDLGPVIRDAQGDPSVRVPTDDWPFLYLRPGSFPYVYAIVLGAILLTSWLAIRKAYKFSTPGGPVRIDLVFFLMGMAFLLLETRMVTALSLLFGSTWIVNASVFSGILLTAFLANLLVARWSPARITLWYLPLALSLIAIWSVAPGRLNRLPLLERGIAAGVLYALPVAFAGVVFSSLLRVSRDPTRALGSNLLGAVLGGVLEYSSMLLGLRSLVLLALGLYLMSCLLLIRRGSAPADVDFRGPRASSG
jgi:SAM-dependent methyltransferase